jgi:hypothetical protein
MSTNEEKSTKRIEQSVQIFRQFLGAITDITFLVNWPNEPDFDRPTMGFELKIVLDHFTRCINNTNFLGEMHAFSTWWSI